MQVGVVSIEDAREMAKERGLDLVEVSPLADPPVCKLLNFGHYLYEQKKKDKKHKKLQKQVEVKGVRLSMRTGEHDLEIKAKQAIKFLGKRHIVKVQLIMRGRELQHKDLALDKLQQFIELVKDYGHVEGKPSHQGYQFIMMINPTS